MRLHISAGLALALAMVAQNASAQQFITGVNIEYDDTEGAPDVNVGQVNTQANTLASASYAGSNAKALTQLGVNKVYGSTAGGIEVTSVSAWLDHFTVAGPTGSTVKMSFSFAVDGLAAFNDASSWNATHFNFQVFALRGDNWSINGAADTSGLWYAPTGSGTEYDDMFLQRYVPERDAPAGSPLPPGTKLPANVIQLNSRSAEDGVSNFTAAADQSAANFVSNVRYDAVRDAYIVRSGTPYTGFTTTTFFDNRREIGPEGGPPVNTLYYNATGNPGIVMQAAAAKSSRLGFEGNFSILDVASFCPMDDLAGEMQCGPGSYDNVVTVEFDLLAGSTFALAGIMLIDELDDGVIDFFNTARLSKIEASVVGNPAATVRLTSEGLGGDLEVGPDGFTYPSMQTAVPEPASWAMMIGGFALIGGLMRRRAAKIAFA